MEGRDNQAFYINIAKIYRLLKQGASSIKNRSVRYKRKIFPTEYDHIKIGMEKGHREEFAFHQHEVQKHPKLLEWEATGMTEVRSQYADGRRHPGKIRFATVKWASLSLK
jgi:hypothetical protein